jgi:hypothetical protein
MYIGSRRLKHTINLSIPAMGVQVLVTKISASSPRQARGAVSRPLGGRTYEQVALVASPVAETTLS